VKSWPNKFCSYDETGLWTTDQINYRVKIRLLCGLLAKQILQLKWDCFWRAAQINSAVTMRLFVGKLAKQVVQLWQDWSVDS